MGDHWAPAPTTKTNGDIFRSLIESSPDAIIVLDTRGIIQYLSPSVNEVLGYGGSELIHRSYFDFVHPDDGPLVKDNLALSGAGMPHSGHIWEFRFLHQDGSWRCLEAVANGVGEGTQISGVAVSARDITERKALGEELAEHTRSLETANQELKELERLKDSFLSVVSHELRTPLTSIKGSAEILLDGDDADPERRREFLQIINNETDRLTRLINDVVDLAKIESGRMVWGEELLNVSDFIRDAVDGTRSLAIQKNLTVRVDLADGLPNIRGEHDKLVQVVNNLLSNAIKRTPGGGTVRVEASTLSAQDAGLDRVRVAISDTGISMAVEDLEGIFERLKRPGDDASRRPKGAWLGLPVCKQIIEHYGGRIWVESEPGKGATFLFTMPAATEPIATAAAANTSDDDGARRRWETG